LTLEEDHCRSTEERDHVDQESRDVAHLGARARPVIFLTWFRLSAFSKLETHASSMLGGDR
jgi:hypothetical protein